jgi:DNA invertase Pin-like site-specific DNA recombinase
MAKQQIPAVALLRRSNTKQEASLDVQRTEVREFARKHGYHIVRWYTDDGISGADTQKRDGFMQMCSDAQQYKDFKAIVCWHDSRFTRADQHEAGYYIWQLRQAGVRWLACVTGVTTTDWHDATHRTMGSFRQEQNREDLIKLSGNVLGGFVLSAKNGSWCGSPPYGYRIKGEKHDKKLVWGDIRKVNVVKRIFREFTSPDRPSMSQIAEQLNADGIQCPGFNKKKRKGFEHREKVWRFDTVKVILQNEAYTGDYFFNRWSNAKFSYYSKGDFVKGERHGRNPKSEWITKENNHKPIIDRRTFDKAQKILAKGKTGRSSKYTPETNPFMLTGKLVCGRCKKPMWGEDSRRKSYECSRAKYHECHGTRCREVQVLDMLAEYVEQKFLPDESQTRLWEKAKRGKLKPEDVPQAFNELKRLFMADSPVKVDTKWTEAEIARLTSEIERARTNLVLIDAENIPAAQKTINDMKEQRAEHQSELNHQPTERDFNETVRDVLKKLWLLATGKPELVKPVIAELDRIEVFTTIAGKGTAKRHKLADLKLHFLPVGGVTGKANPHLPG